MYGYAGKMLFVHLDTNKLEDMPLEPDEAKNFLGGYGIGASFLYKNMPARTDAFDNKSIIGFISGPLNNSPALFGGRYTVVCKSPVTGGFNDANSGGCFGGKLKKSGYDAIFVDGIADKPVYLFVHKGKAEIRDASDLWGLTTKAVEEKLKNRHGKSVGIALIGPAGENMSHIAAVMNDEHRAAARGGPGAVMGSKRLKAIVVKGHKITFAKHPLGVLKIDIESLIFVLKQLMDKDSPNHDDIAGFPKYGTGSSYTNSVVINDAGLKNWAGVFSETPEKMLKDGEVKADIYNYADVAAQSSQGLEKHKTKTYTCAQCPVHCSAFMKYRTKKGDTLKTTRPEYETMSAFGSLLLNRDIESVFIANELCNEYGFDTMSAGGTLAWAMECYSEGVLTKEDLDGIELTWGNGGAVVELLEMMGKNKGVGAVLAKGSKKACEYFGNRGEEFLVTASGIEQPQHDPRLLFGLGRTYMVDPTPGRHVKASIGGMTYDPQGEDVEFNQERHMRGRGPEEVMAVVHTEIMNTSGACAQGYGFGNPYDAVIRNIMALTGFKYSHDEITQLGLRIFTMRQLFNIREGIFRKDMPISERTRKRELQYKTHLKNIDLDFDIMVDGFYDALGWERNGMPRYWSLMSLGGFEDIINDFFDEHVSKSLGGAEENAYPFSYYTGRCQKKV